MKQPQYRPLTNAEIVIVIYAGQGYIDNVPVRDVVAWEDGLIHFRAARSPTCWTT